MSEMSADSMDFDGDMSFDDALAALGGGMEQDAVAATPVPETPAPEQAAPAVEEDSPGESPVAEGTTEETPAAEAAAPSDSFTDKFDPNALPPELLPGYKLMQGEFTRRMQAMSEERKQFEALQALGTPEELTEARELYTSLQDPSTWPELHQALTAQMEAQGLEPLEAAAVATQAIQEGAAPPASTAVLPADLEALVKEDPELAPLATALKETQARLDRFEQAASQRAAAEREAQINATMLADLSRQEAVIRGSNPAYNDEDIDVVTKHSAFFDGNLIEAQKELEDYVLRRFTRYLDTKESVPMAPTPAAPAAPSPAATAEGSEDNFFDNPMDEATKLALHDLQSVESLELGL